MPTVSREPSYGRPSQENSNTCTCLDDGNLIFKSNSSPNVCISVGGKYVSSSKEELKCLHGGADKIDDRLKELSGEKGVSLCLDAVEGDFNTKGVCICLGENKWICQPKEGSAPKTVRICVDTAVKLNEDAEGKNICICVGSESPEKCDLKDLKAGGIYCYAGEDWVFRPKEDSSVQDICVCVSLGNSIQSQSIESSDMRVCICVGTDQCVYGPKNVHNPGVDLCTDAGETAERRMTSRLDPCVPIDFDEKQLEEVVSSTKDWVLMHGACMRSKTQFNADVLQFAPFALVPSTFPRLLFEKAVNLQPLVNELMHIVANNHEFLHKSLTGAITVDPFTAELFKIYETVRAEGVSQPISLGLLRADVMLSEIHSGADSSMPLSQRYQLKQVEVNTIAAGFGWLGPASGHLQRFAMGELRHGDKLAQMPENRALETLAGAMLKARELYGQANTAILFIIEEVTYNICDQRFHEFEIRKQNPNVRVLRRNLTELGRGRAQLGRNKELLVDGVEIAVVYFRCGYAPDQYSSADRCEWNARLLIERSKSIKCPNIAYHLAGAKKIQQVLAQKGVLEQLLDDEEKVRALRDCFTGLYSLDLNAEGDQAAEMAIKDPERYVLKPQREGGGNNVYGYEVKTALEQLKDSHERAAYILMDVIKPPLLRNWMVRPGSKPALVDTVSELGIFGVIIGTADEIFINTSAGHMLRTKLHTANEGGVAAGLGALDSPFLVD